VNELLAQLGKLSVGLAILFVVYLIVKALPAVVSSFHNKHSEQGSTNGDAGSKDVSFWIREYEKVVAPVLVLLREVNGKLDELLQRIPRKRR
jgi:hypothetical protein